MSGTLANHGIRALVGAVIGAALVWSIPASAQFVPRADLWERWTAHAPSATATIDHRAWNAFLERYLSTHEDGVNRIAYASVDDVDKVRLEDYLAALQAVRIDGYSRDEQRAYWVNLYNALTVDVVLDHYPVQSIREIGISPGFFSVGPWKKKLVRVEGEELSLDDIEHRILRPIWKDPRIHYAVNCASLGCPNLMPEAFTAANTGRLLEKGARDFINSAHGARFDDDGRLTASSIYDWFQDDFGGDEEGVIAHLRAYASPALAAKLDAIDDIDEFDYDWTLNDAAPVENSRKGRAGSAQR